MKLNYVKPGINGLAILPALILFIFFLPNVSFAQSNSSQAIYKAASYNGKQLLIHTSNSYISIVPYSDYIIRVTYQQQSVQNIKSYSTIAFPQPVKATYKNEDHLLELSTSQLRVVVNKANLAIYFIDQKGDTLSTAQNYTAKGNGYQLNFSINKTEAIYGGGSRAINLNKRGQILNNYNQAHGGYKFGQVDLNISIPFLISNRHYGLYVDNFSKSSFDVAKSATNKITFTATSGAARFYFVGGNSMDDIMANYTLLTGRQPLPPRWAMGYISSRFGYKSEREIMNVVDRTQKDSIPLDAVVFDLYWYKSANLMGNHSWNPDSFPNPKLMMANLLKRGIKVVPISETYITQKSENFAFANEHHLLATDTESKGQSHIFPKFWAGAPAGLLDIFKPDAQQFYWSLYKQRIDEGVSGWWFDLAEPELSADSIQFSIGTDSEVHNLYGLTWAKTAFDGFRRDFPKSRIFILIRSGFAGMQRYSTFPWSGDISRTYEGLQAQIPIIINMGLGGVGYMHSDGGGFTGARIKDKELYSRWLEFAAFSPVMRTHAGTRGNGYVPEPIFWDDTTRLRVTKYIGLRYQLLPYNYTMAYQNTISGRPLVMPLNYFDTGKSKLSDVNDEYLWGNHILVAPVAVKGQAEKKVLFPAGTWIGFNDHKIYRDSATVSAPIDSLPLFVKAGSIIPMTAPITNTSQYTGNKVILKYYAASDNEKVRSEWFYDDGDDPNSLTTKRYELVNFTTTSNGNKYQVIISPAHVSVNKQINFLLVMPGKTIRSVHFTTKTVSTITGFEGVPKSAMQFKWAGQPTILIIETD